MQPSGKLLYIETLVVDEKIHARRAMPMPDYLEVCETAVRHGGGVLMEKLGHVTAREKGPADLVTEADFSSQETIRNTILDAFASHQFLGEEDDVLPDAAKQRSDYRWIADPLDGTTNYVHGVPHFCVSLALEHRGELLVGAVLNPVTEECFTAVSGQGAFLNGSAIRTSRVTHLSEALAATGFPTTVNPDSPDLVLFLKSLPSCQAVRRTGSAALNLCYVACGRFDVAWLHSAKIWDVAAGVLLIREAGGIVSGPNGGKFDLNRPQLLAAANDPLHVELCNLAASPTPQT